MTTAFIGQPVSRVDGRQKVTGTATYAAESRLGPGHARPFSTKPVITFIYGGGLKLTAPV
jgi:CO/xanthine dehydrogenase Mo-binding subunit